MARVLRSNNKDTRSAKKKSNNHTRRNDVVFHYNTRSSRNHQKKFIQLEDKPRSRNKNPLLEDNTTSVPGTSNTAKGTPCEGAPAKMKIPIALYNFAKYAFTARKNWEAKKTKKLLLKLQDAERMVENSAYYYKHSARMLPIDWKYNPDTFSSLEPIYNDHVPILWGKPEKKIKTKVSKDGDSDSDSDSDSDYDLDPPIELPKLDDVALKEDDTKSWQLFKEFDKDYPTSVPEGLKPFQMRVKVNIDHPFVSVIGNFALDGFNKSCELFVDEGEPNHLHNHAFTKCTYYKIGPTYWFQITILANEYGFRGIYEAIVRCTDEGKISLYKFTLTDIKCDEKGHPSIPKSAEGKDGQLPYYTGLFVRCYMGTPNCRGYNYHDPTKVLR